MKDKYRVYLFYNGDDKYMVFIDALYDKLLVIPSIYEHEYLFTINQLDVMTKMEVFNDYIKYMEV